MFVCGALRVVGFCFYLLMFLAPPRYVTVYPIQVYYALAVSYMILSAIRLRRVLGTRVGVTLLVAYCSFPFIWLIVGYVLEGGLFDSLLSISGPLFLLISSLSLPIALLVESRLIARKVKEKPRVDSSSVRADPRR